jgi:hypothetical protein
MAEKQLAYRTNGKDEIFAEDDPLAELARIVGFEPRPTSPVPASQRHEPAFDLEDELLREFERYDAPRLSPIDDIAIGPDDEQSYGEAVYAQPGNENVPRAEIRRPVEPEFAELPPEVATPYEEAAVRADEDIQSEWADEVPLVEVAAEPDAVTDQVAAEPVAPEVAAADLADELEQSIEAPVSQPVSRTPQWAAASIRLPLANFNAPRRPEPPAEQPVVQMAPPEPEFAEQVDHGALHDVEAAEFHASDMEPDFEQPSALSFPAEQDRHEDLIEEQDVVVPAVAETPIFDLAAAAEQGEVQADVALTEPAYEAPAAAAADDFDDLLADVSRYPVPTRSDQSAPKVQPDVGANVVQPATAPEAFVPEPVVPEPIVAPAVEVHEDAIPMNAAAEDPFADPDFDFDFEGIEMELAGLDFSEPKKPAEAISAESHGVEAPVAAPQPQRSLATPLATPRPIPAIRPELAARPVSAPILTVPASAAASVMKAAPVATIPAFDAEQPLPFDPSEITETDEKLETFDGKNVPVLPHVEKEEPVAAAPDYDFDIDAELANLFQAPARETPPIAVKPSTGNPAASAPVASAKNVAAKQGDELDEFERALEDDFRRSFSESQPKQPENVARMTLESSSETTDRQRARSMRGIAVAAAAVLVFGAGAYGVYGFLFHGSSLGLSSGEPRVITADKEPIKVVPENPGGKVVPNQDKAVYDRVAGDGTQTPKQKQLVSSNEQPVDVVQKTLIPEATSPDDSDGPNDGSDVTATPVGETEDPRLLPGQNSTADSVAANAQDDAPSVSPRKVRTMIVKPDGTLVARDEPAPAADTAAKASPVPAKSSAAPVAGQAAKATAAGDAIASTDLRATNSDNTAASATTSADAAESDAPSADSTPIRVVKTSTIGDNAPATQSPTQAQASDTAPVPSARPAQPATAQKVPVAPKQTQVAVAAPAVAPAVVSKQTPAPAQKQVAVAKPAAPVAAAAPAGAGGYVMQIASLPSEEEAKRSQANLSAKFASVIGGHPMEIRKADIAGKGTYYRVRVAAGSKDDAAALCVRFRAAGGTCLISK